MPALPSIVMIMISVAGTVKDPAVWEELYKMFLGANYFERAGVAVKD